MIIIPFLAIELTINPCADANNAIIIMIMMIVLMILMILMITMITMIVTIDIDDNNDIDNTHHYYNKNIRMHVIY